MTEKGRDTCKLWCNSWCCLPGLATVNRPGCFKPMWVGQCAPRCLHFVSLVIEDEFLNPTKPFVGWTGFIPAWSKLDNHPPSRWFVDTAQSCDSRHVQCALYDIDVYCTPWPHCVLTMNSLCDNMTLARQYTKLKIWLHMFYAGFISFTVASCFKVSVWAYILALALVARDKVRA